MSRPGQLAGAFNISFNQWRASDGNDLHGQDGDNHHKNQTAETEGKLEVAYRRLEQKGFVETFGDAADRRVKLVRITPAGCERVANEESNMAAAEQKLLSALTETEREIFYVLLQKVRNSLQ